MYHHLDVLRSRLYGLAGHFRGFYRTVGLGFVVWILLCDGGSIITQAKLLYTRYRLQKEQAYYTQHIQHIQEQRKLLEDPEQLERFARERFFMKKAGETLYVILPQRLGR